MPRQCRNKKKFKQKEDAEVFADAYMKRVAITYHPMVAYWCGAHNCWHIGHDRHKHSTPELNFDNS